MNANFRQRPAALPPNIRLSFASGEPNTRRPSSHSCLATGPYRTRQLTKILVANVASARDLSVSLKALGLPFLPASLQQHSRKLATGEPLNLIHPHSIKYLTKLLTAYNISRQRPSSTSS